MYKNHIFIIFLTTVENPNFLANSVVYKVYKGNLN
jgi:hypothetical protein